MTVGVSGKSQDGADGPLDVDKVLLAAPRSFCAGVEMAIKALAWMVRLFDPPVYCYHEIVHNRMVVDRFERLGVIFVDTIEGVPPGAPLMLSAHGSPPEIVAAARAKGDVVVNAVCPLVTKVHHEVKVRASKGYTVIYAGHEGHDEAVGTLAVAPNAMRLVGNPDHIPALDPIDGPVAFLTQTTLSVDEWHGILEATKARFPDLWVPGRSDLCFATTNRQASLRAIANRADVLVVIGSATSHNVRGLVKVAHNSGCPRVVRVDGPDELPADLAGTIGVTAGASTAEEVVQAVVARLAPAQGVEVVTTTEEEEYFPPPRELRELLRSMGSEAVLEDDRTAAASDVLSVFGSSSHEMRAIEVPKIHIPDLYCPIPPAINKDVEAIGSRSTQWIQDQRLLTTPEAEARWANSMYGWLPPYCHPNREVEDVALASDWNAWLFAFDDLSNHSGLGTSPRNMREVCDGFLATLRSVDQPKRQEPDALRASLRGLTQRLLERGGPRWMAWFADLCSEYFRALQWEASNRAAGAIPAVDDYLARRQHTGAVLTSIHVGELVERLKLPEEIWLHPDVRALTAMANNVVSWQNDIMSAPKEIAAGEVHNYAIVLQHQNQWSIDHAIAEVASRHDEEVRGFLKLEQDLPTFGGSIDGILRRYVLMLRCWMRGNLDWSTECGRYAVVGHFAAHRDAEG